MRIKLDDILKSKKSFDLIVEKKGIPIKVSYLFAKIYKKIQKEIEIFEKVRNEKIMEFGELLESGVYQVKTENMEEFKKQFDELLETTVEIDVALINIEQLEKCDFEPIIFADLHWLIVE